MNMQTLALAFLAATAVGGSPGYSSIRCCRARRRRKQRRASVAKPEPAHAARTQRTSARAASRSKDR